MKRVCVRHPELERPLTAACLHHASLATFLAAGPGVYEGAYEMEVPYTKKLQIKDG